MKNYKELIICWKVIEDKNPREIEKELIAMYQQKFNILPFANLVR